MRFLSFSFLMLTPFTAFANALPVEQIDKFAQAFTVIKSSYIEDISSDQLMEYALEGMLENLDPHSVYLNEQALSDLNDSTHGAFGGLGIEVSYKKGQLTIISPMDKSPAATAGIMPGDTIYSIENTLVEKLSLKEAISLLKGEPGTAVNLQVSRTGFDDLINFTIERKIISVPSASSQLLEEKWGYVRLSSFTDKAFFEVSSEIDTLMAQKAQGIIFDLRNNPGGLLQAASQISNIFLEEGLYENKEIVSVVGRAGGNNHIEAMQGPDMTKGLPVVVLVNAGSASASEVVAGALQDYRRAVIMGQKTFGKGSVQTVIPLENCALKLTTARYYTPQRRSIQAKGILPDVVIDSNWQQVENTGNKYNYSESSLAGHLENESQVQSTHKAQRETSSALENDYMVQQAIQSLKVMQF